MIKLTVGGIVIHKKSGTIGLLRRFLEDSDPKDKLCEVSNGVEGCVRSYYRERDLEAVSAFKTYKEVSIIKEEKK